MLAPETTIVPAPALVTPYVALEMIPLTVKSAAVVPSSATVKVRVAVPRATGADMVAPLVPVVASFTVTSPPRVSVPDPVMEAPVVAPPSIVTLPGAARLYVDKARVEPAFTVSAPVIDGMAWLNVTVLPGLLIVRLPERFVGRPVPVTWAAVPL